MVKKIISGGQTGADQAGLHAAKYELGLDTGGTMPGGWRTEAGDRPDFKATYGMVEDSSRSYLPRTEQNVLNSDATLIFGKNSAGSVATRNFCETWGKPYWQQYWDSGTPVTLEQIEQFKEWLEDNDVEVLNVAGNREEKNKGIFEACVKYLKEALCQKDLKLND